MTRMNILVPYDNSDHARNALAKAVELCEGRADAEIHVIEVAAPPQDLVYSSMNPALGRGAAGDQENFTDEIEKRINAEDDELTAHIATLVEGFEGTLTADVVYGVYTADTIIDEAKRRNCTMIAMGSRGLGALRGMLGSVSFAVLRGADIPVLIVK